VASSSSYLLFFELLFKTILIFNSFSENNMKRCVFHVHCTIKSNMINDDELLETILEHMQEIKGRGEMGGGY
jgi:hypothetical protein